MDTRAALYTYEISKNSKQKDQWHIEINPFDGESAKSYTLQNLIDSLDKVVHIHSTNEITDVELVKKAIGLLISKFEEYLLQNKREWYDLGKWEMEHTVMQLEAIAFLTGHKSKILERKKIKESFRLFDIDSEIKNNFFESNDELFFKNFSRSLLTLQLLIRVLDPKKIDQRDEQLCGPTSLVQSVAYNNPMTFVTFVRSLAEKGLLRYEPSSNVQNGKLSIKNKKLIDHLSRYMELAENGLTMNKSAEADYERDPIHEVDFIVLVSLRECYNTLVSYKAGSSLFGVTLPPEIATWMSLFNFSNVSILPLESAADISLCERLLRYGYSVTFNTTIDATNRYLGKKSVSETDDIKSTVQQYMEGHFIWLQKLKYNKEKNELILTLTSWGQSTKTFPIKLDVFKRINGMSKIIVGQAPEVIQKMYSYAKYRTHVTRCHPYYYCMQTVRSNLANHASAPEIAFILDAIKKNAKLLGRDSWTVLAKQVQNEIFKLLHNNSLALTSEARDGLISCLNCSIVNENTIEAANNLLSILFIPHIALDANISLNLSKFKFRQLNFENLANHNMHNDDVERKLICGVDLEDIDAACMLASFYIHFLKFDDLDKFVRDFDAFKWPNQPDRALLVDAIYAALSDKLLDMLLAYDAPTLASYCQLMNCLKFINDPVDQANLTTFLHMLNNRHDISIAANTVINEKTLVRLSAETIDENRRMLICYSEATRLMLDNLQFLTNSSLSINKLVYPFTDYCKMIISNRRKFNALANDFMHEVQKGTFNYEEIFTKTLAGYNLIYHQLNANSVIGKNTKQINTLGLEQFSDLLNAHSKDDLLTALFNLRALLESSSTGALTMFRGRAALIERPVLNESNQPQDLDGQLEIMYSQRYDFQSVNISLPALSLTQKLSSFFSRAPTSTSSQNNSTPDKPKI